MASAGGTGGDSTGAAGVNGPSGPGPIVSFGEPEILTSVAWSGSVLLAIGKNDTLFESVGTSGQWALNGQGFYFASGGTILWDGTRFVAVDPNGEVNVSINSVDAGTRLIVDPTLKNAPLGIYALAWSGSSYVGVGEAGLIATSPDANTWTTQTSGTTASLVAVTWTGSQFLALGSDGTIVVSPDGVAWTVQRTAVAGGAFYALAWTGSRFVVTCVAWSPQLGLFAGASGAYLLTSPDGATWTIHPAPISSATHAIVWAGNRFVGVGDGGIVLSSRDGAHWIVESMGISLKNVTWTGQQFVIVGGSGTYLTSPDGLSWTIGYYSNGGSLLSVAPSPSGYVFSSGGYLYTTPDLTNWTIKTTSSSCPALISTGSQCLAVCSNGSFWAAPDCQTWSSGTIAAANDQWASVVWTGSQFVSVGIGGIIATSPDGMTWTTRVSGTTQTLLGVAWSGQQLVAVGNGVATTSPDGVTWTAAPVIQNLPLNGVAWAGTRFLAVGPSATLLQSPDGVTWSGTASTVPVNSLLGGNLNAIAFSGTRSIVVGDDGIILAVDR
jgi:hypothetical protein